MVNTDIELAHRKIEIGTSDKSLGRIYGFTNENLGGYIEYLKNRKKILSVTASGDQILTSILLGTKEVDSFDISRFPRYYLELKKAAILSLSQEEFMDFFIPERIPFDDRSKLKDMYSGFNQNMKVEYKKFWDELYSEYDVAGLFQSDLFIYSAYYNRDDCEDKYLLYLQDDNYKKLKEKLKNIEINYYVGNIVNLYKNFQDSYDLVYLSNIIDYIPIYDYCNIIDNIYLNSNGVVLTYAFDTCYYKTYDDIGDIHMIDKDSGVIIYTKKK